MAAHAAGCPGRVVFAWTDENLTGVGEHLKMFYLAEAGASAVHAAEGVKPYLTWHGPGHEEWVIIGWTWVAMVLIVAAALMARKDIGVVPRAWAGVFEHIYDWIDDLATSMMGPAGRRYVPFVMTIFLLVLVSNWIGLIPVPDIFAAHSPFEAPSASLNTTLALAIISFCSFTFFGIQKHYERARSGGHHHAEEGHEAPPARDPVSSAITGFGTWLAHFIEPTPTLWTSMEGAMRYLLVPPLCLLFLGLNIIEEFARILSLTIRLFGNIAGEHQVKVGLFTAMVLFGTGAKTAIASSAMGAAAGNGLLAVLLWASSAFVTLIGALAGFIQAFIFMVLTLSYISHVVADEH